MVWDASQDHCSFLVRCRTGGKGRLPKDATQGPVQQQSSAENQEIFISTSTPNRLDLVVLPKQLSRCLHQSSDGGPHDGMLQSLCGAYANLYVQDSAMQWSELLGHSQQREWFRTALENERLATSFLFVGAPGIGKHTFALLLAKSLLCRRTLPRDLAPCGLCEDCQQVNASTHPDLILVSKPPGKSAIPIELLIGNPETRMQEGLCHNIGLKPYAERRKIAILDDADSLHVEAANCMLKTLEEPPLDSILILIGTSLQKQLPTIRSRCQSILFQPLSEPDLALLMLRQGLVANEQEAAAVAKISGGSLSDAAQVVDAELMEFRSWLLQTMASSRLPLTDVVKHCSSIVDAAGKEPRAKRDRMKFVFRIGVEFYRSIALLLSAIEQGDEESGHQGDTETALAEAVQQARRQWKTGSRGAVACWRRCLAAIEQVDRNANQATLLEAWISDLAQASAT